MNIYQKAALYIARYAPSKSRFLSYLEKKKVQNIDEIFAFLNYDEMLMMDVWIRSFLNRWLSDFEIKTKLLNKKFVRKDIDKKLEQFSKEIHDWAHYQDFIRGKIRFLSQKGKSKQIIEGELRRKYPYFSDEIKVIIASLTDEQALASAFAKYQNRYDLNDFHEKQKFYQALMRKGFRYDEINNYIKNIQNNF